MMTIDTHEDYEAAIQRLGALGEGGSDGLLQDEFLDITAAMLSYETRNHPALAGSEETGDADGLAG